MDESYTNVKELGLLIFLYWFSAFILSYFYGHITLELIVKSKMFCIDLVIFIVGFLLIFVLFISKDVFKVSWDEKKIIFKYLCCKKKTYLWESISGIYYCPKFGVVHLFIATDDGEFYSMPDVSDKLYQALKKYAKVEIKTIRHPMEVLPYLRERRENARKSRKKLSKRR